MTSELERLMSGVDPTNEVINLWFELTYVRYLLNILITQGMSGEKPNIELFSAEKFQEAKDFAIAFTANKFPRAGVKLKEAVEPPKPQQDPELTQQQEENGIS